MDVHYDNVSKSQSIFTNEAAREIHMSKAMQAGRFYRVDHPLFDGLIFNDGWLLPSPNGYIIDNNKGPRMEGKLFTPPRVDETWLALPPNVRENLRIKGMTVIFPDETKANIYEVASPHSNSAQNRKHSFIPIPPIN